METTEQKLRQSALIFVQNYTKNAGVKLTLKETIRISNVVFSYLLNGYSDELGKTIEAIDDYIMSLFPDD